MGTVAARAGLARPAATYVGTVVAVGAVIAIGTAVAAVSSGAGIAWGEVLLLGAGVAVLNAFPLALSHHPDSETLEPEELLVVPALVLLPTLGALAVGVVASVLAQVAVRWLSPVPRLRSRTPTKMAFNGAVGTIVWAVAASSYALLAGVGLPAVAAATVATIIGLTVNQGLVHAVVRLVAPTPVVQDRSTRALAQGSATLAGALLATVLVTHHHILPWAVVVTVSLTALASRALGSAAVRRSHMLELLSAAQVVHGSVDPLVVEQGALAQARDMLTCREAVIREHPPGSGELGSRLPVLSADAREWLVVADRRGTYRRFDGTDQELLDGLAVLVASARDRARVVAELQRRDELQQLLLSSMSHDLRGPLATALSAAGTLRERDLEPHARDEIAAAQERSLEKMSAILDDLLVLVRLERHRIEAPAAADPVAAAHAVAADSEPPNGREVTVVGVTGQVAMPAEALGRTLDNLVQNALVHGRGAVSIHLTEADHQITIQVDDEGPGVPPELRERVFEPFVGRGEGSLGLGLFLAHRLVEHYGGALWVEDTPGGGASFRVRLPAAARDRSGSPEL